MALDLAQQASLMEQLDATYKLQAQLSLISKNLLLINAPPNAQVITVVGGNLYQLAEKYYNDATLWNLIADVNNIADPEIVGQVTLLIPPINTSQTGGILDD